jgi:DNA polymerase-1
MEDPNIDKVFFNAKFDWHMIDTLGINIKGNVWDVRILAHLINGRQKLNLDEVSKKHLPTMRKVVTPIEDWFKDNGFNKAIWGENYDKLPPDLLQERCHSDTVITAKLFMKFWPTVAATFPRLLDQEHRLIPIVKKAETRGYLIDVEEAHRQHKELGRIIDETQIWLAGVTGNDNFNANAYNDQAMALEQAGLLWKITERTKKVKRPKLSAENLRNLHHPVAHMLLIAKQARMLRNTFIEQMLRFEVDGVLHPGFDPCGTLSGRFSSAKPNLLNIPGEGGHLTEEEEEERIECTGYDLAPHIKRIFKVREGYANIHSDKSKVEVRMVGHYTNDPTLKGILSSGEDIHAEISQRMFESTDSRLRVRSKAVVFGYIYGAGDATIGARTGGGRQEGRLYRTRLESLCPALPIWKKRLEEQIRARGYVLTDHGRRHYLYPGESYMAVNRMCQGTAGDEVKACMVRIGEDLVDEYPDSTVLINIHDDIGSEVPLEQLEEILPIYDDLMAQVSMPFNVPLPSDTKYTTTRWSDTKSPEYNEKGRLVV